MRATEHAPRGPFRLLECRYGLADIVECGGGVAADRLRVKLPQTDRDVTAVSGNASRHGNCSAQQRPGFFEALETKEGQRVVVLIITSLFAFPRRCRRREKGVDDREPELTLGGPSLVPPRKCLLEAKVASVDVTLPGGLIKLALVRY